MKTYSTEPAKNLSLFVLRMPLQLASVGTIDSPPHEECLEEVQSLQRVVAEGDRHERTSRGRRRVGCICRPRSRRRATAKIHASTVDMICRAWDIDENTLLLRERFVSVEVCSNLQTKFVIIQTRFLILQTNLV